MEYRIRHPRLSLRESPLKGIPYQPEDRGDGDPNFGFTCLKDRIDRCEGITEAADEPALLEALRRLNARSTAVFSSGCEKAYNEQGDLECPIGYFEFAFNSPARACDRDAYGRLLIKLDHRMVERQYSWPVNVHYWFAPTQFNDHRLTGYSAALYLQTESHFPRAEARRAWRAAMSFCAAVVSSERAMKPPHLYSNGRAVALAP